MFEETLRIDPSHHFLGMRLNFWVSLTPVRRLDGLLRLVAVPARPAPPPAEAPPAPKQPTMAIPKGRVRPGR